VEDAQENKTGQEIFPPLGTPQGTWAKTNVEKLHAFAKHLAKVPQPHPSENKRVNEEAITHLPETTNKLEPPINHLKRSEAQEVNNLKTRKSPGYDLINGKILRKLPIFELKHHAQVFNATMLK
jgi:hypothetical protein